MFSPGSRRKFFSRPEGPGVFAACAGYFFGPSDREFLFGPSDREFLFGPSDREFLFGPSDREFLFGPSDRVFLFGPSDRVFPVIRPVDAPRGEGGRYAAAPFQPPRVRGDPPEPPRSRCAAVLPGAGLPSFPPQNARSAPVRRRTPLLHARQREGPVESTAGRGPVASGVPAELTTYLVESTAGRGPVASGSADSSSVAVSELFVLKGETCAGSRAAA